MARAEVECARDWRVPRSIFLGRVVQPGEPWFLDEDRDYALALRELEADTCPGCGHPRSESTSPENEFAYTAHPMRCHSCKTRERAERAFTADADGPTLTDGLQWYVTHD